MSDYVSEDMAHKTSTNHGPLNTYHDLLQLLKSDEASRKDIYSELMQKEDNVLHTISRVSSQERIKNLYESTFSHLSIKEILARFAFTWQNIFNELVVERMFDHIIDIFFEGDRKIYVGMMVVFIGMFLFMSKI